VDTDSKEQNNLKQMFTAGVTMETGLLFCLPEDEIDDIRLVEI
jgi:hypothetical protein